MFALLLKNEWDDLYEMNVSWTYWQSFHNYVNQTIMYTFKLYSDVYQLFLNKTKKMSEMEALTN